MMVIGLTGGIGSGKSTVATMLRNADIPVIDADELAKEVTKAKSTAFKEIVEFFGPKVLNNDNTLDRKLLLKMVFSNKNLLEKLENIIHPRIERLFKKKLNKLAELGVKVIVYMAPLIFEKGLHLNFNKTILIIADEDIRRERIAKRDGLSINDMKEIFKAQFSDRIKISLADEVIKNNGTINELYKNLLLAWERLTGTKLQRE
jgi:dephospho-CoA kinase